MAHWRDSARQATLGPLDARACLVFLVFFLHMSWITFWFSVITAIVLTLLKRKGFTPEIFIRYIKQNLISGRLKVGRPWWLGP